MNPRRARRRRRTRERRLRERVATAIRQAVRDQLPDMAACKTPKTKVNWGWCADVSEGAREILKGWGITATVVVDDDELRTTTHEVYADDGWSHSWIWVEGKHHDAEALYGVRRWLDLPHFKRWLDPNLDREMPGVVDITPVLSHGDEQRMFFRSAKFFRLTLAQILEEGV